MLKLKYILNLCTLLVLCSCGNEFFNNDEMHISKQNTFLNKPIDLGIDIHLRFEKYNMDHGLVNNTIFDIDAKLVFVHL